MTRKKLLLALGIVVLVGLTGVNTFIFIRGYKKYRHGVQTTSSGTVNAAEKQAVDIKTAKQEDIKESTLGSIASEGEYKFESLSVSKLSQDHTNTAGYLAVATHNESKAHFVFAFAGGGAPKDTDIADGWKLDYIATDPVWEPGACASKPTYLINGRYIFIDDGLTNPGDRFSSYIVFDLQKGGYRYFGGENFSLDQQRERIISITNENDQIVFYIERLDDLAEGSYIHTKPISLIRRVVDPETMHYKNYEYPLVLPAGITNYTMSGSSAKGYQIGIYSSDNSRGIYESYNGKIDNQKVVFTKAPEPLNAPAHDEPLDLELASPLGTAFPDLAHAKPYENSPYKTAFTVFELGSYESKLFGAANNRYLSDEKYYSIPFVYDKSTKAISFLTKTPVIESYKHVQLGVY